MQDIRPVPEKSTTIRTDPLPPKGRRRQVAAQLAVLCLLVGIATYLWTAPFRAERALQHASLQQILAQAKRQPNNPRVFYYEGLRLRELGQTGPAQAAFARAATLDGDDEDTWLAWASVSGQQSGAQYAYQILTQFLKTHPRSARAHAALALLYEQKSVHSRAYEEASAAAKLNPGDAANWQIVGIEAMALDNAPEAEPAFQHAIALAPGDWRAHEGLGNALLARKQLPQAITAFRDAVRLAPRVALTHLALGTALLDSAVSPADYNAASLELLQAATLDPNTPGTFLILGQSFERQDRWKQARETLHRAETLDPTDPHVHFELARVDREMHLPADAAREAQQHETLQDYQTEVTNLEGRARAGNNQQARLQLARLLAAHGQYAKAADAYRNLLMRDPDSRQAEKELAALSRAHPTDVAQPISLPSYSGGTATAASLLYDADLIRTHGKLAEAEKAYRDLLAQYPNMAEAYEGLGFIYDAEGKTEDEFDQFQKAVTLNPHLPRSQANLAKIYYRASLPDEAVKHLLVAVQYSPQTPYYWHELGLSYGQSDIQYQQAEDAYKRAVQLDPKNGRYFADLGSMQWNNHEDDAAKQSFQEAMSLAPDDPDICFSQANFLLKHQPDATQLRRISVLLHKTLAADPRSPAALAAMGDLALKQGNTKSALVSLQAAVTSAPRTPSLWYQLSRAYQRVGDTARAADARRTFTLLSDQHLRLISIPWAGSSAAQRSRAAAPTCPPLRAG